jgi:cell division protein FtsN
MPNADAEDLFGPDRPSRHWMVYAGAAVLAFGVVLAGLSWFGRGNARVPAPPAVPASVDQSPRAPAPVPGSESAPASSAPAAAVEPAAASPSSSASSSSSSLPAGQIYVAVAAFRTPDRAAAVAAQLTAAGLRAEARASPAGTWQQVVVGPFLTADEAAAAQQALTRQGFAGSRILK